MVQVGCTINYGRSACGKKRRISNVAVRGKVPVGTGSVDKGLCGDSRPRLSVERSSTVLAVSSASPRVDYPRKVSENTCSCPQRTARSRVPQTVGLWRSWERASMAWKRSSVRSRPGPPYFQLLADTPLFSLVAFGSKTLVPRVTSSKLGRSRSSALMASTVFCTLSGISCM